MRRNQVLLSLLPLLIPFAAVFGCGLLVSFLQSVGLFMFSYRYDDLWFAYRELFESAWFGESVAFSLYVSLAASLLSTAAGSVLAYLVWTLPLQQRRWAIIYKIPLVLPHMAVGFIAVIILSRTGVVASVAYQLGIISTFESMPQLLYSRSGIDLILAYVYKETPFVMVMVYGILCRFDRRLIEAARMLGASGSRVFLTLIVPFIMPVVNTTFIILFVYTFGGFDLPFVLGDSHPGMLSIRIYDYFFQKDIAVRPVAMAMLCLVFLFSLLFIYGYQKLSSSLEREVRKL